jgi:hypothetical protein
MTLVTKVLALLGTYEHKQTCARASEGVLEPTVRGSLRSEYATGNTEMKCLKEL